MWKEEGWREGKIDVVDERLKRGYVFCGGGLPERHNFLDSHIMTT
jgi:hypothetical protein